MVARTSGRWSCWPHREQTEAELLGINARTVWRMAKRCEITLIRFGERVLRWRLSDLREHLDHKAEGKNVAGGTHASRGAHR